MSQRTWACVECGTSYRRDQMVKSVRCAQCNEECESVAWKIRIPSPKKKKEWRKFWDSYREEKAILEAYYRGERVDTTERPIMNMKLLDGKWQDCRHQA